MIMCTNQKIRYMRNRLKSRQGFAYGTESIEVKAVIEILVFLGSTKISHESTSIIRACDGIGKPLCLAAMNQKRFIFLLYFLRFNDYSTKNDKKLCNKLVPVKNFLTNLLLPV